ncbi:bifunctional methylenetetrahydrofolate dehydrogenase/methenyltetrahydrofolate cyclohydrolase FolD [Pseudalkalibacillus caeni]|uniref:Bifunctional protein FolD n=1 Tax=Exobacillus caeni TaxID=2574798 RepID=A0A5R9F1V0_9BACL|nr:bifunctional methylenetetrahydrofolate dehydrogenase/methenyltetrahydrofolate cyclohydrolase FolD [Pseudalkalibacillus caeni]TLS36376.1 bifunctional methylenetetrahydrofolate dehydrogenase/methenyltetrahydrofolate cyclohydrolase FolD [Pseudalkalibacillus caeni]
MAAELILGKELAKEKREQIKHEVAELKEKGVKPGLAVILIGEDPASQTYVNSKAKACEKAGMHSEVYRMDDSVSQQELLEKIDELNENNAIHGILVQLPLPEHISEKAVIHRIIPEKDVDGFHPINAGKLMIGEDGFVPCTPLGVLEMVKSKGIPIEGKHVVVIGRSNIVGKPAGQLFLRENATVTYCHSRTANMKEIAKQADILIVAVGRANMIGAEYVKNGAVVLDVGINRLDNGKLCGDVDFEEVKEIASYITPVPGGVGPMTITMLLHNTVKSAKNTLKENQASIY